MEEMRAVFKAIYKASAILITIALATGAAAAFWYGDEANGLWLVGGIAAVLALIAGLSIHKLEWQDQQMESWRSTLDDVRRSATVSVNFADPQGHGPDTARAADATRKGPTVSVNFAEPEVHRVDAAMVEAAKRMAGDGTPIDDICRAIDRDHDRHDPVHQEAFRRIVRAMIEQA